MNKCESIEYKLRKLCFWCVLGYMLLAGRVRHIDEETFVKTVIEKHLGVQIDLEKLFSMENATFEDPKNAATTRRRDFEHIVWTYNMRRMAVLVKQAIKFKEPVLLVGETG